MGKKAPAKKGGAGDGTAAGIDEDAATTHALTPRAIFQRTWAKRVDDAVLAMRRVQQLLQQHTSEVDTAKRELEELTLVAAGLWSLNVDELPPQLRDRQRPSSQRTNSPNGSTGRSATTSPTQKRRTSSNARPVCDGAGPFGADATAAPGGAQMESVEQAIMQVAPATRPKVSAALQTLFYAAPSVLVVEAAAATPSVPVDPPPLSDVSISMTLDRGGGPRKAGPASKLSKSITSAVGGSSVVLVPPVADIPAAAPPASADADRGYSSNGRRNGVPLPLFVAMKDLQGKRARLEAQLTIAVNATAQQLQRFQLLQEELMVSQYGLDAARRDPQQELQAQLQRQLEIMQQQQALALAQQQQASPQPGAAESASVAQ